MKTVFLITALVFSFSAFAEHGPHFPARSYSPIRPFSTDGCTDFANGTKADPALWKKCCELHDLAYWAGGTDAALDAADLALKACVAATGETRIAEIMYLGVRLGHLSPISHAGMQWGNAWSETAHRKTTLTLSEINALEAEILKPVYASIFDLNDRHIFINQLRSTNP